MRDTLFAKYYNYVKGFEEGGRLSPMLKLKLEHSVRVADNARVIAEYNNFSVNEIWLSEVCGLFHDVGRFRQLRQYATFRDADSINHGECGYEVLLDMGWLELLPEKAAECVLKATRYHNAKEIPEYITDGDILRYLHVVRDSDKLDIYYVFYDAIKYNKLEKYPEIVHNLDLTSAATEEIVDSILDNPYKSIDYCAAKSMADFLLIPVQWSYDLHSAGSYRVMHERGIMHNMREIIPNITDRKISAILDGAIQNIVRQVESFV